MEWYEVLFKGLSLVVIWAIPAILVLVVAAFAILTPVFIWAGVVSGLFRVIRDTRQRQKRRAKALREAEALIQGKVLVGMAPKGEEQLAEAASPGKVA